MPEPPLVEALRQWDPERIGGYTLIGRLGAGAMGRVYLGRSAAGRLVAVKTIKIELAEEPEFRNRFAQEVAAARRVSGAFTAAVVAADSEADMPWLATAYVPAPSLSALVRACGPLTVPAVRWLAAGCAEALESIHNAGLVHRDLKPSNVLVSPDGPRVIDFGVARAAERIQLTVTRGAVGTPAYMAPEQARDTRQATVASDVFSLGATMLYAATGHAPYQGDTVMDVLVQLATEPPDLTGLPADLADIVVACLERDPRKRPTSAAVLAHMATDIGPAADDRGHGPAALSSPALALIAEYRKEPTPSGPASPLSTEADEETFGSRPSAGRAQVSRAEGAAAGHRKRAGGRPRGSRGSRGPRGSGGPRGSLGPRGSFGPRRRRILLVAGSALAAAAMIAVGAVIGTVVAGNRTPVQLGPFLPPSQQQGGPQQGGRPPPNGKPFIGLPQVTGDRRTTFAVHGQGWMPDQQLTVTLKGHGDSPMHPIADNQGNFNYVINQDHEFFPGLLPLGTYQVIVTQPNGARAVATFAVTRN